MQHATSRLKQRLKFSYRFSNGYSDFADNLFGSNYQFDWLIGGTEGNIGDVANMFNAFHISTAGPNGWEAAMNPFAEIGGRRLLTPIEIDIIGDAFHLEINDLPVVSVGDVNCDGVISLLDVEPFVELVQSGGYPGKADLNGDGFVNLLDIQPFVQLLSGI